MVYNYNMISIAIENTSVCGANCVMCPRDKYMFRKEHMDYNLFTKIVGEICEYKKERIQQIDICGFGDPLLDPQITKKILFVRDAYPEVKLTTLSTCQFLKGDLADFIAENIDDLKISNYGFTKETYEAVHRGSLLFEDVKSNILDFLKRSKRPHITMTYLILESINDHEMDIWKEYWEDKVDDIQIWYPHNYGGLMTCYDEAIDYDRSEVKSCGRVGNDFMFCANGDVLACCFDVNHKMKIGNIKDERFVDIVRSERLTKMQEIHKECTFRNCGLICEKCDQILNRKKALYYSSNNRFKVGEKSQRIIW